MKKRMLAIGMAILSLTAAAALSSCGGSSASTESITVSGSSSVSPVMKKLAAAYEEKNENVRIIVNTSDSSNGIKDTQEGKNDIGMASRKLKDGETGVESKTIAIDGLAIIANKSADVEDVTSAELYGLYAYGTAIGSITNAITREEGSGSRDAFDGLIKDADGNKLSALSAFNTCVSTQNNTGSVLVEVSKNVKTIGYVSLASVNDTVKALKFAGVEATVANIKSGEYKLQRPFNIVLSTEREVSSAAKAFVEYILSADGQKIVTDEGCVSIL